MRGVMQVFPHSTQLSSFSLSHRRRRFMTSVIPQQLPPHEQLLVAAVCAGSFCGIMVS